MLYLNVWHFSMLHSHDSTIFCPGSDFQDIRTSVLFYDQTVISRSFERVGEPLQASACQFLDKRFQTAAAIFATRAQFLRAWCFSLLKVGLGWASKQDPLWSNPTDLFTVPNIKNLHCQCPTFCGLALNTVCMVFNRHYRHLSRCQKGRAPYETWNANAKNLMPANLLCRLHEDHILPRR